MHGAIAVTVCVRGGQDATKTIEMVVRDSVSEALEALPLRCSRRCRMCHYAMLYGPGDERCHVITPPRPPPLPLAVELADLYERNFTDTDLALSTIAPELNAPLGVPRIR